MATKVKPSRLQVTWTPQAWDVPVYVDEDCFCWWAGWGWGWWCAMWWCITWTLCDQTDLQWALNCKLDASALSDTNYWWAWSGDTTHTPTKNAIYTKLHTMDVEIWNKAADNTVVKLSWNQVIWWTKTFCISPVVPEKCAAAVNCGTAIATEAQIYNVAQAIPTDNCQLANWCWYTTCTGTLVASDIQCLAQCCDIPTDNCQLSNGCWYTTCTGTLQSCDIACINWCCLTSWWNICIWWWIQLAPNTVYCPEYHWYWPQSCYDCLAQYYTCCANDTAYFTTDE